MRVEAWIVLVGVDYVGISDLTLAFNLNRSVTPRAYGDIVYCDDLVDGVAGQARPVIGFPEDVALALCVFVLHVDKHVV